MRGIGSVVGVIVGLALVAGAIASLVLIDWRPEPVAPEPVVRPLRTIVVGQRAAPDRAYPALVRPYQDATLAFQVSGVLRRLEVTRGDRVEKGQLLMQLDLRDFQSRLDAATARHEQANTELAAGTRAFERGGLNQMEFSRLQTAVNLTLSEQQVAKKALEDATLNASFDGLVADIFVENFENIAAGAPVMRLQNITNVRLQVNVDPARKSLARLDNPGVRHSVRFDFLPGREFDARVVEYTTQADPVTQTFLAIFQITPPDDALILPGMSATVIERPVAPDDGRERYISIPIDAVATDATGASHVWVVGEVKDGVAPVTRAMVELGEILDDTVVVRAGLEPGRRIAAAGVHHLAEGQIVRPLPAEGEAGAR